MSALSVRGGCPLVSFPFFNYGPGSRKLVFHLPFAVLFRRRDTHGVICDGGYGYVDMMDMDVMVPLGCILAGCIAKGAGAP